MAVLVALVAEAVDAADAVEDAEVCDEALLVTCVGDAAVVELDAEVHAAVLNAKAATRVAAIAVAAWEVRTSGRLEDTRRD